MYTRFHILKYENVGDGVWSETGEELTSCYDVQVNRNLEGSKDKFSFKVDNVRNAKNRVVEPLDLVNIHYLINGESPSSSNLILNGLVKNITVDSSNKRVLRVEGTSFSFTMTQALSFFNPGPTTYNVMEYLEKCLKSVQNRNEGFEVEWDDNNPTLKSDGTSFPVFTEDTNRVRDYNKSMAKILNTYLINDYTGDGDYFWYVNNDKKLVIRKRFTDDVVLNLSSGEDFEVVRFKTNGDDVKNYVVVKCGVDLNNNPINAVYDDVVSRAKHGFKYHVLVDVNISKDLKIANPSISNDDLRTLVKIKGRKKAEDFVKLHNKGYLMISAQMKPRLDFSISNNVQVSHDSYANYNRSEGDIANKVMRVVSVQYSLSGLLVDFKEEVGL